MALDYYGIQPQDWVRDAVQRSGDSNGDGPIAFKLWFVGTSFPYARVNIATTTNNLVFRQGPSSLTAIAAGSGGTASLSTKNGSNPYTGTSAASILAGTIEVVGAASAFGASNMFKVVQRINQSKDWYAALMDVLPTDGLEQAAGTGIFLPGTTTNADGAFDTLKKTVQTTTTSENLLTGANVIVDTSIKTRRMFWAGVTANGKRTAVPYMDSNVLHDILEIRVSYGAASTAGTIDMWACDDTKGTVTQVGFQKVVTAPCTRSKEFLFGSGTEPLVSVKGRRFVVRLTGASPYTATSYIKIVRRSYAFGPNPRRQKLWAYVNQA